MATDSGPLPSLGVVDNDFVWAFMRHLSNLREERQYTDVTLRIGQIELPCHKVALSAASEYFRVMFSSGLQETTSDVVEIKGTDGETLKNIVSYIYSGHLIITPVNVQSLIQACDLFQFAGLKSSCEKFMLQEIVPSNCIGFYRFAKLYSLESLERGARRIMLTRFQDIAANSAEFKLLSGDDLIEYIADDGLEVTNEDIVFEAVMIWMKHEETERAKEFHRIVENIRLPFCSGSYLCHVVAENKYMRLSSNKEFLEEAQFFQLLPEQRQQMCSSRSRPRQSFLIQHRLVLVGGLMQGDCENRFCWYLKEETNSWELLAHLPKPNWKFYSVCVVHDSILLSGGYQRNVKKDTWLFDTVEKKWKAMPSMIEGRCKHRSVLHGDFVYVIGGEDDSDRPIASVERFDLRTRSWSLTTPLPKSLSDPLAVTFGQYIYVFGGIEDHDTTFSGMLKLDTVWGEWHRGSVPMPLPCRLGSAIALNDSIYIVGGYTRSCMRYHPPTDTWSILNTPIERHGNAPAVVWRGRILLGGGDLDSNETISLIEQYDPTEDSWSWSSLTLKEPLSCHSLLSINLYGL